ncbi:MAG: exodeoxyribonuclease V subunit alpha [Xanthomonadales bacterium]|nr:exodeoxyribonuclease V subunit alpha [Xanthomonadales bacterium]
MNTGIAGDRYGFSRPSGEAALPEVWRELDRAVWRWVLAHGGAPAVAALAGWASHADGQGHSALPLSASPWAAGVGWPDAPAAALAGSDFVSVGALAGTRPLVLDDDHLYLLRNHRAETAVAAALAARRAGAVPPRQPLTDADLCALFNGPATPEEARQRDAVARAPGKRLMVLTGGPGTGKTSTVLRMLLGLSREHQACHGTLPQVRIAAPTGKAAQRLGESLRQGADRLLGATPPLGPAWATHLSAVLAADAGTVHRLLGSRGRQGGFVHHARHHLPADIVVLDEASMLDLGLLRALLAALREDAVLVLVGDADQLTSVATGSVMMDVVEALEADLRDDLVRLEHCFRADATLVPIHAAVRAGDPQAFRTAWRQAAGDGSAQGRPAAALHAVADAGDLHRRLTSWAGDLQRLLDAAQLHHPVAPDDAEGLRTRLAVTRRQQLLCAQREGPFGALQAAAWLASRLRRAPMLSGWADQAWWPGRCVIVTRNDAAAQLYNGDVGICLLVDDGPDGQRLQVAFEPTTQAVEAGQTVRLFDPNTLPPHEDAFALTIHKSQGSEYDHVAVLLPPDPESPLLSRQTLYTGLSRARSSVELWSVPDATDKAIATVLRRHGRLASRIVAQVMST